MLYVKTPHRGQSMFQASLDSNPHGGPPLGQTALRCELTREQTAKAVGDLWGMLLVGNTDNEERRKNNFGGTKNCEKCRTGKTRKGELERSLLDGVDRDGLSRERTLEQAPT